MKHTSNFIATLEDNCQGSGTADPDLGRKVINFLLSFGSGKVNLPYWRPYQTPSGYFLFLQSQGRSEGERSCGLSDGSYSFQDNVFGAMIIVSAICIQNSVRAARDEAQRLFCWVSYLNPAYLETKIFFFNAIEIEAEVYTSMNLPCRR